MRFHRAVQLILVTTWFSLFLFGPIQAAPICKCVNVFAPEEIGTRYACYDAKDEADCKTHERLAENIGVKSVVCTYLTTNSCFAQKVDTVACNDTICSKSSKPCSSSSDCTQLQGNAVCSSGYCFFDEAAKQVYETGHSELFGIKADMELHQPLLEFHLPGLSFTDIQNTLDADGYIHLPFIGELIAAIYKFGLVVGSILAAVMIIVSGIRILVSAGGEGKVEGYKRIGEIVIGLAILWGSYSILYTINPDLVNFKALKVKYIERKDLDGSEAGSEKQTGGGECGGGGTDRVQTIDSGLGLSSELFWVAKYSTKFGSTCKKPAIIKAIILHYTITDKSASARGIVKDWSSPQSAGSICQIIVDGDGKGYQITEKLEEHVICQGGSSGFDYNTGGIGIEIMGMNEAELLTNEKQKQLVIALVKKLAAKYSIPLSNKPADLISGTGGIFSHKEITKCEGASNQKVDPGETYTKQIILGAGGVYTDWSSDPSCQKN